MRKRAISSITKIITHCSASDHPDHDNIDVIRRWHVEENMWDDVGYHYFIPKSGELEAGRDILYQGAHTLGENEDSIAICLSGMRNFTPSQFVRLGSLVELLSDYVGTRLPVYPHNYFTDRKTCPNFDCYLFEKRST